MRNYLTEEETALATEVGLNRHYTSRKRGVKDRLVHNISQEGRRWTDIWGARAELWFSIISGLPWTGRYSLVADVGDNIEVKTTDCVDGHLLVRPKEHHSDPTEYIRTHIYVFVPHVRRDGTFTYAGYMHGADVMQDKYWVEDDAWWVPPADLIKELPNVDRAAAE